MTPALSQPFEFVPSRASQSRIRALVRRAADLGIREQTVEAIATIIERLTQPARRWGDPVRRLGRAELTEYRGLHWSLHCLYAVHDRIPIVFLTDITPLEENPLFGT